LRKQFTVVPTVQIGHQLFPVGST